VKLYDAFQLAGRIRGAGDAPLGNTQGEETEKMHALTAALSPGIICGFPDLSTRIGKDFSIYLDEVLMYAVIKTGGKQYKVAAGEKLKVEQIPADIGSEITLDQVLAVGAGDSIKFGAPLVDGAKVLATVVAHGRHDKVKIFKMRRRKHYQKRQGHRQNYTELQIVSING
jgi:large subunit ribosomal protein L21